MLSCEEHTKFAEFVKTQSEEMQEERLAEEAAQLEEEEAIREAEALAALHGDNKQ